MRPKVSRADLRRVFEEVGVDQLRSWIELVANGVKYESGGKWQQKPNPGRAAELMLALAEYVKPKLARVEQAGPDGGAIRVIVRTEGKP